MADPAYSRLTDPPPTPLRCPDPGDVTEVAIPTPLPILAGHLSEVDDWIDTLGTGMDAAVNAKAAVRALVAAVFAECRAAGCDGCRQGEGAEERNGEFWHEHARCTSGPIRRLESTGRAGT